MQAISAVLLHSIILYLFLPGIGVNSPFRSSLDGELVRAQYPVTILPGQLRYHRLPRLALRCRNIVCMVCLDGENDKQAIRPMKPLAASTSPADPEDASHVRVRFSSSRLPNFPCSQRLGVLLI